VAGVDPADTADPAATRAAIDAAGFVVALDLRASEVTRVADVVLPVAPVSDKAGTFVNWEGRVRPFEAALRNPASLPDLRILAGIAEEMGAPLGFRTVPEVRAEMEQLGQWDGERPALGSPGLDTPSPSGSGYSTTGGSDDGLVLATWKQSIDNGRMQDGDKFYRATARPAVALVTQDVYDACGPTITITGDRGWVTLPAEVGEDLVTGVMWVPANSFGAGVLSDLASPGSRVRVEGGQA
ncbi:MAG: molybdopterin-dependent oxidoreductase, partial [Candidatus Nanopelagicales bacterium]|nr:molybdopterin-dependent oxidoreductase [Candidatus Nanopelagicales bacterium]